MPLNKWRTNTLNNYASVYLQYHDYNTVVYPKQIKENMTFCIPDYDDSYLVDRQREVWPHV